jgi:hypothetical protein
VHFFEIYQISFEKKASKDIIFGIVTMSEWANKKKEEIA